MIESLLTDALALVRDVAATVRLLAELAWAWTVALPVWVTIPVAAGVKLAIVVPFIVRRRRAKRPAPRPDRTTAGEATPVPRANRPVSGTQSAIDLMSRGVPAVDISRRTGLARDAVSLLLARGGADAARQGTPVPAVVAASRTPGRGRGQVGNAR